TEVSVGGTGGRCQEHIGIVTKFQKENKGAAAVAVCDVWDGHEEVKETIDKKGKKHKDEYRQGLYPSAKRCGLDPQDTKHVTKDYRRILDLKEVDVVCTRSEERRVGKVWRSRRWSYW